MYKLIVSCGLMLSLFSACEEKMTEQEIVSIGIAPCRRPASFIKGLHFDPNRSAFSTEVSNTKGIILIQGPSSPSDTPLKRYQHPSWLAQGYMGSVTTDETGNAYTFPIPFVNTLDRNLATVHTIYKIDEQHGEMKLFTTLPKPDSVEGIVPFGLLGIYYDCHGQKLYASSVSGSTRDKENGKIYVLDKTDGHIIDQFEGVDAVGLCVCGLTGEKRLYFGKARTPDIYSIELTKSGKFKGEPRPELTLDQLGPRGDDKARKIRFDKFGFMQVHGVEFNFSLAAQSNKPESIYRFLYNSMTGKWDFKEVH